MWVLCICYVVLVGELGEVFVVLLGVEFIGCYDDVVGGLVCGDLMLLL